MGESNHQLSQEQLEEFERFMMGQMSEEEEVVFTQKLDKEPDLEGQFKEFRTLFWNIEERHLREAMQEYHRDLKEEKPIRRLLPQYYPIAAGIAVLLTLSIWYLNQGGTNDQLFDKYYSPDPGLPTVMSTASNFDFYDAMVQYKEGKYGEAIDKWQALVDQGISNDTLLYFLGAAHMANKAYNKAEAYLKLSMNPAPSAFSGEANFQLGLIYLKNNQTEKAKSYLKDSDNPQAQSLLQDLENQTP